MADILNPLSGGTWRDYTPAVVAVSGALGATSGISGRWKRIGDIVFFHAQVLVTDIGTGAGALDIDLPVAPSAEDQFVGGRDITTSYLLGGRINQGAFGNVVRLNRFDGGSAAGSGSGLRVQGWYKVA